MTDSRFETASTLCDFFSLITKAELPADWDEHGLVTLSQHVANLVTFLKKYECDAMLQTLKLAFHYRFLVTPTATPTPTPLPYSLVGIVLGSIADDVEFCVKAMRADSWKKNHTSHHGIGADTVDGLSDCRPNALSLLPCHMPHGVLVLIPPTYIWALSWAWLPADGDKTEWINLFREARERERALTSKSS